MEMLFVVIITLVQGQLASVEFQELGAFQSRYSLPATACEDSLRAMGASKRFASELKPGVEKRLGCKTAGQIEFLGGIMNESDSWKKFAPRK